MPESQITHNSNALKGIDKFSSVVELLRYRSDLQAEQLAYTFLADGDTESDRLTYQELDRRARAIASQLQTHVAIGERALLLYPPGLDYLAAFFGCLYAGVVAVPAYPPRNQRNTPRIKAILADAQPRIVLTNTAILPTIQSLLAEKTDQENLQWLTTDNLQHGVEESWQKPSLDPDTLAFLQYTSGSTGIPKGVMLSHGNLLHNAATTYQVMEHSSESTFVSWLPTYHDMGLIGGILQPLYGGFTCILMPPASFLQRPYNWLQAISRYKGTTSGGPNFAYEQKETLDLSSWSVAFNGAEPIRHDTLERFAAAFADCGFRPEAFYPCYGMAEATLMITGAQKADPPIIKTVEKAALESHHIVESSPKNDDVCHFIGCGQSIPEQKIVIAHPEALTKCQNDEVGEIWVSSPSVGKGYWNRPQQTEETFHAYLSDTGQGPFLRTGDLGFLDNGEVFITGRAKDLIIIRGRNLYPQDIELTSENSHPALRSSSSAAFAIEVDNEERLVVIQELEFRAKPNLDEVVAAIRQAITEQHEVQVHGVILIKPGSIPKTSSGKIQRRATRAKFLAKELEAITSSKELEVITSSIHQSVNLIAKENHLTRESLIGLTSHESQLLLESYLVELVARVFLIAPAKINKQQPLSTLGIDSLKVFELKNQIENDLEVAVSVADFFEGCSIADLANNILMILTTTFEAPIPFNKIRKASDFHPVSFAQQRLWFINQLAPDSPAYNINIVINLSGRLDIAALTQSLKEIIRRHEVLRTNFLLVQGELVQVINPDVNFTLPIREYSDTEGQSLSLDVVSKSFDLSSHQLLRGLLLHLNDEEYKLILSLHHIIADGWSMGILIRELTTLYQAFSAGKPSPLEELSLQYVDFTYWQQQYLQPERLNTLLTYWKQQLGDKLPVLNLPTDRPRGTFQSFKGAQERLVISKALTESLKQLSDQEGATLYMTLLAAFNTLLYRYTDQTDILVGSPIANRNRTEIFPLIGF